MKITKKKVVITLLILLGFMSVAFAGTYYYFSKYYDTNILSDDFKTIVGDGVEDSNKDRINILVLGMEHTRTDMIMVATFDPVAKTLNMISIPRDTFVERDYPNYYPYNTYKKINAVYELPTEDINRLASKVSEILGIPIHEYAMVDYDVVAQVTDAVGGVEVDIPFNMDYDDPWSDPPLHVHFKKGSAFLNGDNAIEYLRWRHNNDGSYGNDGDVGRIKRQQNFIEKVLEKALNPTILPKVIDAAFKNVKTSMSLGEAMSFVKDAVNIPKENIHFYQEIGEPSYFYDLWYFLPDVNKTQALMKKIMNDEVITQEDTSTTEEFRANAERGILPDSLRTVSSSDNGKFDGNNSYSSNNSSSNTNNTTTTTTRRKYAEPSTKNDDDSSYIIDHPKSNNVSDEEVNNSVNNNATTNSVEKNDAVLQNDNNAVVAQPSTPQVEVQVPPTVEPTPTPVVEQPVQSPPVVEPTPDDTTKIEDTPIF